PGHSRPSRRRLLVFAELRDLDHGPAGGASRAAPIEQSSRAWHGVDRGVGKVCAGQPAAKPGLKAPNAEYPLVLAVPGEPDGIVHHVVLIELERAPTAVAARNRQGLRRGFEEKLVRLAEARAVVRVAGETACFGDEVLGCAGRRELCLQSGSPTVDLPEILSEL